MWILIIIVLIVIILVAVVKNDNKQIQIDHLQNGGFSKSYPLVTKYLEEEYEMSFFEDLGNSFSYSKNIIDVNNKRGILYIGLKLNSGRETIIFSSFTSSTGLKYEGQDVSTLYTANKYIVEGVRISIEKLEKDGILSFSKKHEMSNSNEKDIRITGTEATIHLKTAGTLSAYLTPQIQKTITRLTLSGEINGTDILILRYMSGSNEYGLSTNDYNLKTLDISNIEIVEGGDYYYIDDEHVRYTSLNNILGDYAFYNCTELESICLPKNILYIGISSLQYCSNFTEIDIPNSVLCIGDSALSCNTHLNSIHIPNSISIIGEDACSYSEIKVISIPESISVIGDSAFNYCNNLEEINIRKVIPLLISENVFEGVDKSSCILKVPIGSKERYSKSPVWCDFETIIEI